MKKESFNKKVNGSGRTRNFATVVFPDNKNTPENWLDIIEQSFIPCFVSPIHDKDLNQTVATKTDESGEEVAVVDTAEAEKIKYKKPHYHVIIMYDSVKTNEQAREFFDKIGGVGMERVASLRGYARYLIHMDNEEKAKYKAEDVRQFGGADWHKAIATTNDKYTAVREMCEYCIQADITSYAELFEFAMFNREDWFRVLCDSATVVMEKYLKAKLFDKHKVKPYKNAEVS